jgi:hypothetical protein
MLLLQRGGEVAYAGPINQLSAYLESVGYGACPEGRNIADFALEVAGGGIRDAPVDAAATASSEAAKATADATATAPTRSGGLPATRFSASARCVEVKKDVASLGHDIHSDFQRTCVWCLLCFAVVFTLYSPMLCLCCAVVKQSRFRSAIRWCTACVNRIPPPGFGCSSPNSPAASSCLLTATLRPSVDA